MAKQNITVKIIGKPYPLAIDGEKEELYRLAEREINAYVARIEQAHFKGFSKEDCLAMAAFQIAVAKLALAQSRFLPAGGGQSVGRRGPMRRQKEKRETGAPARTIIAGRAPFLK